MEKEVLMTLFVAIPTILLIGAIYRSVMKKRKDKMYFEVWEVIRDVLREETNHICDLEEVKEKPLLRIKAIFDHLGVNVELKNEKFTPSIDTFRSLSFLKEYLPEIDEQMKLYEETNKKCEELSEKNYRKKYAVRDKAYEMSVNKWTKMTYMQKKFFIILKCDEFDRAEKGE